MLDRPPKDNPKLRRLLETKAPWERNRATSGHLRSFPLEHVLRPFLAANRQLDEWLRRRGGYPRTGSGPYQAEYARPDPGDDPRGAWRLIVDFKGRELAQDF